MAVTTRRVAPAFAVLCLLGAAACGTGSASSTPAMNRSIASTGATGSVGSLRISGAYIPQPASTAVAAAYFTVTNTGTVADRLTGVSSPVFGRTELMTDTTTADGGEEMVPLPRAVTIPAHGKLVLQTGGDHAMLERPSRQVKQGQTVELTLTFARAGQMSLRVPVVGMTGLPGATSATTSTAPMSMPSS